MPFPRSAGDGRTRKCATRRSSDALRSTTARVFFGIALLVSLCSGSTPMGGHYGELSNTITGTKCPSALQQLATFAAMEEVAEEENLNWGSTAVLSPSQHTIQERAVAAASARAIRAIDASTNTDAAELPAAVDDGVAEESKAKDEAQFSSSSSSRRRPHRRQHRKRGVKGSDTTSLCDTACDSVRSGDALSSSSDTMSLSDVSSASTDASIAATAATTMYTPREIYNNYPDTLARVWTQLHVMEVAYSTRNNNFVHISERFLQYERMYPIVYRCELANVVAATAHCPRAAAVEAELLAKPQAGLESSRYWSCDRCGRKHEVVREMCMRCRAPSHFAKLFMGQVVKEMNSAGTVLAVLHAARPDVTVHRIESHTDANGRGKGCASVYVGREHAAELVKLLHKNVYLDLHASTGGVVMNYVYTEQRAWLGALAQIQSSVPGRFSWLPWSPMVVEEAASDAGSVAHSPRFCKGGDVNKGGKQLRGGGGVIPAMVGH